MSPLDFNALADRLSPQHRGGNTERLARRLLAMMQTQIAEPVNSLSAEFDDMAGWQLDDVGALMGFPRPRIEDATVEYFGFSDEDTSFEQAGILASTDPIHYPGLPINDDFYRRMLRARRLVLSSTPRRETIREVLETLDPHYTDHHRIQEHADILLRDLSAPLTGLCAFRTSTHNAIIGAYADGSLARVNHTDGVVTDLAQETHAPDHTPGATLVGLSTYGRRMLAVYSDGVYNTSGTEVGLNVEAPSMSWSADNFIPTNLVGPGLSFTSLHRAGGERWLVGTADATHSEPRLRWVRQLDDGSMEDDGAHATVYTHESRGQPRYPDPLPAVAGLTHDYRYNFADVGNDSVLYLALANNWILELAGGAGNIDTRDVFELEVISLLPAGGQLTALLYHDTDLYGCWQKAGETPQLFIFNPTSAATPLRYNVHIAHPNALYLRVLLDNQDKLFPRSAGVEMRLHTHTEI